MLWGHITLRSQVSTWTSRRLSQRIWAAGNAGNMGSVLHSQTAGFEAQPIMPVLSFPLSLQEAHLPGAFESLWGSGSIFWEKQGCCFPLFY